jgi:hypothetical protein
LFSTIIGMGALAATAIKKYNLAKLLNAAALISAVTSASMDMSTCLRRGNEGDACYGMVFGLFAAAAATAGAADTEALARGIYGEENSDGSISPVHGIFMGAAASGYTTGGAGSSLDLANASSCTGG